MTARRPVRWRSGWTVVGAVAAAVAALAPRADAQFARQYAAVSVGLTHSNVSDYLEELGWRWGGVAGITVGAVTFDHAYLELAPAWTRGGGGHIRLDYLDVPLILGGILPVGTDLFARLYGAIGLGLKLGCGAESTAACDIARGTAGFVSLGVSLVKMVESGDFAGVDARYVAGISEAFEDTDAVLRSWQVRALFGLPLRRR